MEPSALLILYFSNFKQIKENTMTANKSPCPTMAEALGIRHRQTMRFAWGDLPDHDRKREKMIVDQHRFVGSHVQSRHIHSRGIHLESLLHATDAIIGGRIINAATFSPDN
jgi:hypothetical protein